MFGTRNRQAQELAIAEARSEVERKYIRCVSGQKRWKLEAEATDDAEYRAECLFYAMNYEIAEPLLDECVAALQSFRNPNIAKAQATFRAVEAMYNETGQQYLVHSRAGLEFERENSYSYNLFKVWN